MLSDAIVAFFGMRRFSNISGIRKKDISFLKDSGVQVFMRKSKTSQLGQGARGA